MCLFVVLAELNVGGAVLVHECAKGVRHIDGVAAVGCTLVDGTAETACDEGAVDIAVYVFGRNACLPALRADIHAAGRGRWAQVVKGSSVGGE